MKNIILISKLKEITTRIDLSLVGCCVIAFVAIYVSRWIYKWRNPKCNGKLPPGSMGLPFIGETLQLLIPSGSLDLPPFINKRIKRYGKVFKTNIAGREVVVSTDPEFNYFLLRQDGKLVEGWALDTFGKVFDQGKEQTSKYKRNLVLKHMGVDAIKEELLSKMEVFVAETLKRWSKHDAIEVKGAAVEITIDFSAKKIFSGGLDDIPSNISEMFSFLIKGLMSFPVNLPGTSHNKCLKVRKNLKEIMREVFKNRMRKKERNATDMLGQLIEDLNTETFITEDFVVQLLFGLLFATSETISTTLALAFKFLAEHHSVLDQLTAEHEAIEKNRENSDFFTWSEYKSMTFAQQVINEVLRLGNISPGLFRQALQDIPINEYIIPKGWIIMIGTVALHLDSNHFEDPLSFNPSRWKNIQPSTVAKCFMPFGSGMKQCAGAEYSRAFLAIFLHVLVTKYRWEKVKVGEVVRAPIIIFPDEFHFKISEKKNAKANLAHV